MSLFLWPALVAEAMERAAVRLAAAHVRPRDEAERPAPAFATPSVVRLDLGSLRLRTVVAEPPDATPSLVVTPYALHDAAIADFAPGHSLVQALAGAGLGALHLVEWRSAGPAMRDFGIDALLADLLVAVDDLGGRANLIGLCQGGWLALLLAARFPGKVRHLVLAGAPVDTDAAPSALVTAARATAPGVIDDLVAAGGGRVSGRVLAEAWARAVPPPALEILGGPADPDLAGRFGDWFATTLDLPGPYYREVVERIFRDNLIPQGRMPALGRPADPSGYDGPLTVLAARDDDVVPPGQVLAATRLVGTPRRRIRVMTVPGPHLALFMGRTALRRIWPAVARSLARGEDAPRPRRQRSRTKRPGAGPSGA